MRIEKKIVNVRDLKFPRCQRRLMPDSTFPRWVKSGRKTPPHGSLKGTLNEIAQRESWFCHNYPMAQAHRGVYRLSDTLSVVFANDGYPDYNTRYMVDWFFAINAPILASHVERGYTSLWLVESSDLVELDRGIWNAWAFRCLDELESPKLGGVALLYAQIQKWIAYDGMRLLGLHCPAPIVPRAIPTSESVVTLKP